MSTSEQAIRIADQLAHIERMLSEHTNSNPQPTWLLVAGHYPVYSVGEQGDVSELHTYLRPLLEKYHVHAYLCGHDHMAEHIQDPDRNSSVEYFVVGAGTMTSSVEHSTDAQTVFVGAEYASYAVMEATSETLTIRYLNISNSVTYEYTLTNPGLGNTFLPPVVNNDDDDYVAAVDDDVDEDGGELPIDKGGDDDGGGGRGPKKGVLKLLHDNYTSVEIFAGALVFLGAGMLTLLYFTRFTHRGASLTAQKRKLGTNLIYTQQSSSLHTFILKRNLPLRLPLTASSPSSATMKTLSLPPAPSPALSPIHPPYTHCSMKTLCYISTPSRPTGTSTPSLPR